MKAYFGKIVILVALGLAITGILYLKGQSPASTPVAQESPLTIPATQPAPPVVTPDPPIVTKPSPPKTNPPAKQEKPSAVVVPAPVKPAPVPPATVPSPPPSRPAKLPMLLELGSDSCRPCQMMQPVLAELCDEYAGKLRVEFIDVWKDETAGRKYGIQAIPTQIIFDAEGKELYRHIGYYPKDDIIEKLRELGIE